MEALDLEGKDKFLGGLIKGKSDPYGVLQIGNQLFQSKTVKESLHPKWNEVYEVRDDPHPGSNYLDLTVPLFFCPPLCHLRRWSTSTPVNIWRSSCLTKTRTRMISWGGELFLTLLQGAVGCSNCAAAVGRAY